MSPSTTYEGAPADSAGPARPDPARIARLLEHLHDRRAPVVERDGTVHFLYQAPAEKVELVGDMNHWLGGDFLTPLPGTKVFHLKAKYPPDARLEYVFRMDGNPAFVQDPANPHAVPNGWGRMSELRMPRCKIVPELIPYGDGSLGDYGGVKHHRLGPGVLPYPHDVYVYLPPERDQAEPLPAVYLQDGADYIEYAHVPAVLTRLIEQRRIRPLAAVFVCPPNRHQPARPNRTTEYGLDPYYIGFLCDELVPFIDANYRMVSAPESRLIAGASYGGLISAAVALRRPDVFGAACSQSGYFSFRSDALIEEIAARERIAFRFCFDVGTFERAVGREFLPEEEGDFLAANRRMRELLRRRGVEAWYREYPEGHTWGNWRAHLFDVLIEHFAPRTS